LAKRRNPDGKRFLCSEIIEVIFQNISCLKKTTSVNFFIQPCFVSETEKRIKKEIREESEPGSVSVKLATDEDLITIVASGPYMTNGTIQTDQLELLVDVVKAKNAHVLILVCIN